MTPSEASAAAIRRLKAELAADRSALNARATELEGYLKAGSTDSSERAAAMALALDRSYTALESLLSRIARTLEGGLPSGDDWHRSLLHGAALDIEQVRPPVLGSASIEAADTLRAFRHFLRHAYAAPIDAARVRSLAEGWMAALPTLEADLEAFGQHLRALAAQLD